jgi:hypothetical protein
MGCFAFFVHSHTNFRCRAVVWEHKKTRPKPRFLVNLNELSQHANVRSLQTLLALLDFKLNTLVLKQGFET